MPKSKGHKSKTIKEEEKKIKEERKMHEDEEYEEFYHDESNDGSAAANFSTSRKLLFALGKAFKYSFWAYIVLFAYHFYLIRKKDKPEESFGCIDYFLHQAYRIQWHCNEINKLLTKPPVEKLLQDKPPLPPHIPFPKTLILGLRGVTVRSEYKLGLGFEFKKRPGLSTFLQRLARSYEIVIFGDEESSLVQEICEALDPEMQMIGGRLGHESTLLKDGKYIKDLSYMNRDIKDIVCIEFNPDKFYFHKDNVLKISEWDGDTLDRELLDLIPFLEHLATPGLDVRNELRKYGNENTSAKFNEIQSARREIIQKKRESGFGGIMSKLGNQSNQGNAGSKFGEIDENKVFPTQFKNQ